VGRSHQQHRRLAARHRFQGSWLDSTTDFYWVIARWYAPSLGRLVSEDSMLGTPEDPPSRHLYAYGADEPVGRWDVGGHYWLHVGANLNKGERTVTEIARTTLTNGSYWPALWNANRRAFGAVPSSATVVSPGQRYHHQIHQLMTYRVNAARNIIYSARPPAPLSVVRGASDLPQFPIKP
jgi:RHS repeat-associated protein